ncbi:MAG TPA: hypothetical protein VG099_01935 [Gemmataceae bacterium]|jgi:hypothetical protein|nr:hypothetical protein [Gemmataceae bacterium]
MSSHIWEHAVATGTKCARLRKARYDSRRIPWYAQEKRAPAPFLCTYMGRT